MYKALDLGSLGIRMEMPQSIELAAKYGFAGVTLSPDEIIEKGADRVNEWLEKYGVINAGFGTGLDYNLDGAEYEGGLLRIMRRAKAARATGAVRALTYLPSSNDERDFDAQYAHIAAQLRPYAKALEEQGIALALEFIGTRAAYVARKYPFIHTLPEMCRLCDTIGTRNCGVLVDAHHMHTAGHSMDDVLSLRADQVAFVHVNDAMAGFAPDELPDSPRLLPGESGVIDCKRLLRNLRRIGYEGPVVAEPFYAPFKDMTDADEIVRQTAEALARVW